MSRSQHCASARFDRAVVAPLFKSHEGSTARVTGSDGCWAAQAIYSGPALVRLEEWLPGDDEPAVVWEYDPSGGGSSDYLSVDTEITDFRDSGLHRKTVRLGPGHSWRGIHEAHDPNSYGLAVMVVERDGSKVTSHQAASYLEGPRQFHYSKDNPF